MVFSGVRTNGKYSAQSRSVLALTIEVFAPPRDRLNNPIPQPDLRRKTCPREFGDIRNQALRFISSWYRTELEQIRAPNLIRNHACYLRLHHGTTGSDVNRSFDVTVQEPYECAANVGDMHEIP